MSAETISPVMYSIRPWPNGRSGAGFALANLKPTSISTALPASARLLKASAMMATEPVRMPMNSLAANSSTLNAIAAMLHSVP